MGGGAHLDDRRAATRRGRDAKLAAAEALATAPRPPACERHGADVPRGRGLLLRRFRDVPALLRPRRRPSSANTARACRWELETCNAFAFWPLYFKGEYGELTSRYGPLIAEVRERGARLAEADLTTFGGPFVWLAADDPDGADRAVRGVMGDVVSAGLSGPALHDADGRSADRPVSRRLRGRPGDE